MLNKLEPPRYPKLARFFTRLFKRLVYANTHCKSLEGTVAYRMFKKFFDYRLSPHFLPRVPYGITFLGIFLPKTTLKNYQTVFSMSLSEESSQFQILCLLTEALGKQFFCVAINGKLSQVTTMIKLP